MIQKKTNEIKKWTEQIEQQQKNLYGICDKEKKSLQKKLIKFN